jgi:fructokinase
VLFGTLIQRSETSRNTLGDLLELATGSLKVCDINLRRDCYCRQTIIDSLAAADVLKLNDGEVMELVKMLGLHATDIPAFCAELNERYDTATCVVTLGERGAFAWSAEEGPLYVPGISVPVVDTVGSGDSFTAAFVSALLDGQGAAEACLRGNLLGALVATKPGGTPQVTQAEVEALRASKAERIRDARLARFEVP